MMTFDPSKVCFDHFDLSRITNYTTGSFLQIQIIDQSTIKDLKDIDINMY